MATLSTINGDMNNGDIYMGRYLRYKPKDKIENTDYWAQYFTQAISVGTTMVNLGQWKLAENIFNQLLAVTNSANTDDPSWIMMSSIVNARLSHICANITDKRQSAIQYAEKSLSYLKRMENSFVNQEVRTAVYIATAIAYQANKDYDKSTELLDSAKVAYRNSYRQDTLTFCTLLNNTGQIYYKQKNWDKAIECFKEAMATGYDSWNKKSPMRSMLFYNIGQNMKEKFMLDSALIYHNKALEIRELMAEDTEVGIYTLYESYRGIAYLYYMKKDYIRASELYEKAYVICRDILGDNDKEVISTKKNAFYCLYYGESNSGSEEIKKYFNNYMSKNAFVLIHRSDSLSKENPYYVLSINEWNIEDSGDVFSIFKNNTNCGTIFATKDNQLINARELNLDNFIFTLIPIGEKEKEQIVKFYLKNKKKISKQTNDRNK